MSLGWWRTSAAMRAAMASLLVVGFAICAPGAGHQPLQRYEATRMSMACAYSVEAYGPDPAALPRVVEEAFDEVDRIDRLMSHYKPESPLSQLNRDAGRHPVAVEGELFDFIATAIHYTHESDGAFDITVGPLMKAWGFFRGEGRMPTAGDLAAARRHVGAAHVTLDAAARTIAFDEPGVELDLGGIAKGYAVDRVVQLLKARGVSAALVSAGGSTIYGLGAPPGRNGWEVAIQDPIDARKVARVVHLMDRAVSVAGRSEKSFEFDGVRYSHIMDPRTGRPVQGMLSVVVLAWTGTAGDALDDALFVLGAEGSRRLMKTLPGTEAFFFLPAGSAWTMVHESGGR
jgi:thiamine biosynthesis lipoprotein